MAAPRPDPGPRPIFAAPVRRDSLDSAPPPSLSHTSHSLAPTVTRPEPARSILNNSNIPKREFDPRDRFADPDEVDTNAAYGGTAGSGRPGLRPIQLVNERDYAQGGGEGRNVEPFQPQMNGSRRNLLGGGESSRDTRPGGWQRFFNHGTSSVAGSEDDHSSSWHRLGTANEKSSEKSGKKGEFDWSFENVPDTGDGQNHRYYLNGTNDRSGRAVWVVDDQSPVVRPCF